MLSNLRHSPTIEEMAHSVDLSESHLLWLFKREVGMSPIHYLRHLKLEAAREMLENTFLPINRIKLKVGINDQSHFIRAFREKYGTTPSKYREQNWTKSEAEEQKANE